MFLDHLVALAAVLLEAGPVHDGEAAAPVREEAPAFELLDGQRDAGAPHPDHHRQQVVREAELGATHPVVRQEIAALETGYRIGRLLVLREVLRQAPAGFSAATKTFCTEFEQRSDSCGDDHLAATRLQDASDDLQQRRLARAVASDDTYRLATVDIEADVAQRVELAACSQFRGQRMQELLTRAADEGLVPAVPPGELSDV